MNDKAMDLMIPSFRQIHYIRERVALYFGVSSLAMLGERRSRAIARPRQVAMYLCSELLKASLPQIGMVFGNRDHTTVMHAIKRVCAMMATDRAFAAKVEALRGPLVAELAAEIPDLTQAIETAADAVRRDAALRLYRAARNNPGKLFKMIARLGVLFLVLLAAPVQAQETRGVACFSDHDALVASFAATGHYPAFFGRSKFGHVVTILRHEAGGFVVIHRAHDGKACMVDAGERSVLIDLPPSPPARRKGGRS